jgi:preprotein translocase subunit SecG
MEGFNDQLASFISLARALFGDFDIDEILNNSRGYTNAVLFLTYLFVAVFIMLSMFLAILGENQAKVRGDQDDAQERGDAPPEYGTSFATWRT